MITDQSRCTYRINSLKESHADKSKFRKCGQGTVMCWRKSTRHFWPSLSCRTDGLYICLKNVWYKVEFIAVLNDCKFPRSCNHKSLPCLTAATRCLCWYNVIGFSQTWHSARWPNTPIFVLLVQRILCFCSWTSVICPNAFLQPQVMLLFS